MKSIKQGKIVLDRSMKTFRGAQSDVISSFEDIQLQDVFPVETTDEYIINQYDASYRKYIDVWKVEFIIQTKT